MAGHSKWANIKHKKAKVDKAKGKIFGRLIREIVVAVQEAGPDKDSNPRLRLALVKAKSANLNKDAINRAIERGAGGQGESYMSIRYEGYGPGGAAVMVHCLTDNKNRTVGEVRHAFTKHGGNLGTSGSVAFLFEHKGIINVAKSENEDEVVDFALEHDASDIIVSDDSIIEVITEPESYIAVLTALKDKGFEVVDSNLVYVPTNEHEVTDDVSESMIKMLDMLDDLDDVQEVTSNATFAE